jgi:hypothetical protein
MGPSTSRMLGRFEGEQVGAPIDDAFLTPRCRDQQLRCPDAGYPSEANRTAAPFTRPWARSLSA